jgi:hypothetical protein
MNETEESRERNSPEVYMTKHRDMQVLGWSKTPIEVDRQRSHAVGGIK